MPAHAEHVRVDVPAGPTVLAPVGRAAQTPAEPRAGKLLLTIDEAAKRLGIGRTLMYRLVSSGEVDSVKVGRLRRVPSESLGEYVSRLRTGQAKDALAAILPLAERGLERGYLDPSSLAGLETAVARLRAAMSDGDDRGEAEDGAA